MMLVWLLLGTASAQDCENPQWVANEAEELIGNFLLQDASDALDRMEAAYACSAPAEAEVLSRHHNARGMLHYLADDLDKAAASFRAAHRVAPAVWNGMYGAEARAHYEASASDEAGTPGSIALLPTPRNYTLYVDGSAAELPLKVPSGLHLLQIQRPDETMGFGRILDVPAGEQISVTTGLPAVAARPAEDDIQAATVPLAPPPRPEKKGNALLVSGLAVGAAGVLVGAGTWAATRGDASVTESYETNMRLANLLGWSAAGVGVGLGVAGTLGGRSSRFAKPSLTQEPGT